MQAKRHQVEMAKMQSELNEAAEAQKKMLQAQVSRILIPQEVADSCSGMSG